MASRSGSCYRGGVLSAYKMRFVAAMLYALPLAVLAGVTAADAMVVVQRDFPELVARAEQVVVGTVTAITEEPDASGAPYTVVTFSDLTVLKGEAGDTLRLRLYGGHTGDMVLGIPDMPSFSLGERDVLFVAGNGNLICPLVGVWQGRFYVRFDAALGTDIVEDSNHQPLSGIAGRALLRAPATSGAAPLTLDDFRQSIADELAHPHASP
jgi:hypothetical protein